MNVQSPDRRMLETIGLPVTIWCNVMKENPDSLPEDTREIMYTFASQEAYTNYYSVGSFNSIKWSGEINTSLIDQVSYSDVIKYTTQCIRYAPKASLKAVAHLTSLVWSIDGYENPVGVGVTTNDWGLETIPKEYDMGFTYQMKMIMAAGIGKVIFGSFGFMLLTILGAGLYLMTKKRVSIIHFVPIFLYDFGTMLLLSGADYRFFLLTTTIWIPILWLMYRDETCWKKKWINPFSRGIDFATL